MSSNNIRDIVIYSPKSRFPIFLKRMESEESFLDNRSLLGELFHILDAISTHLKTQSFLKQQDELLEMIYCETHIIIIRKETHIMITFLNTLATKNDKDIIKKINTMFTEQYSDILQNWNKEIEIFQAFEKTCQEILSS